MMVTPGRLHHTICGVGLVLSLAFVVSGILLLADVFSRTIHPVSDTVELGAGGVLLLLSGALAWRFAKPFVFAVAVTENELAWRTLFGWQVAGWDEVEFVLVQTHTAFGAREVYVKAAGRRFHYGWYDATDWYTIGPLESFPADEAKALTHTIVVRARLERREPGVWARSPETPVSTGVVRW
ncbi:MAG: hypothetical protein RMM31_06250 [Anaerolineae bacterium]|nr:hypothetical protein [Anaerolineae bacterium]